MKNLIVGLTALSLSMMAMAQATAPMAKDTPAAARRDAPAAVDLTKKGVATGLPPAAAAKAKSKADATKGIKPGDVPAAEPGKSKEPAPAASK